MEALARFVKYYNPRAPSRIRRSFGMIGAKYRTSLPGTFCRESRSSAKHEISELTKSREKLPRLLDRFVERDDDVPRRKTDLRRALEKSRKSVLDTRAELRQIEERLAALPGLEETLERFREAGLEDRLREQSLLVREERLLASI